jgi:hypothetical protein
MVKVVREEKTEMGVNALRQASSGRIRRRCRGCGLEWESSHYAEACPLRELETAFLEAWIMVSGEATS